MAKEVSEQGVYKFAARALYDLGFNVIPVNAEKKPIISWASDKRLPWEELERYLSKASGIAVTGKYLEDNDYGVVVLDLDDVDAATEILIKVFSEDWAVRLCGQGWSFCGLTGPRPKNRVKCECKGPGEDCECVVEGSNERKKLSELKRGMYIIVRVSKSCLPGNTVRSDAIEVMVTNYEVVFGKHPSGVFYQPVVYIGRWVPVDIEDVGQGEIITCDELRALIALVKQSNTNQLEEAGGEDAKTATELNLPEPTKDLSEESINRLINLIKPVWWLESDEGKHYHDKLLFGLSSLMRRAGIKYETARKVVESIINAGIQDIAGKVDQATLQAIVRGEERHLRETIDHVYNKPTARLWGRKSFEEALRSAIEKAIGQGLLSVAKPEDWFRAVYEALGLRRVVVVPDRVTEGEERRFVAEKSFDYDNHVFSVVIREVGNEGNRAEVTFSLEVDPPIYVYVRYSVYDASDEKILGGRKFKVKRVMKAVRSALSTKAIRNHGPIANYLRLVYRLVVAEAREYARELRQKVTEELRKNEEFLTNPLRYVVTNVLGKVHYGDEIAKKTCFLALVTAWLPAGNRVNCTVIGPSSSGKSTLLNAIYECMPKRKVLGRVVITSASPKAIFYEGKVVRGKHAVRHILKARHKVIFYAEPTVFYGKGEEEVLARELFKLILSDTEDGRPLCHKAVDPDKKITRYYCLDGKPVLLSTIPSDYLSRLSDQEYARLLTTSVDSNPETDKEVFEFLLNETPQRKIEFKQEAALVSKFLVLLPTVKSIELSDEAKEAVKDTLGRYLLDERSTRHIRRALRDLVGLAAAYDLLYYTAGLIREGEEVPMVLDKLTVSSEAVRYVWDLVRESMEAKVYAEPLAREENVVYRYIKEAGRPVKRAEVIDALAKSIGSKRTIDGILRALVDKGRIVRCGHGFYAMPGECPGSEKITKYTGEEQQQNAANQGVQENGDGSGGS
jgi:energy-coupling factor transporter ATP-binding protein EcfA2